MPNCIMKGNPQIQKPHPEIRPRTAAIGRMIEERGKRRKSGFPSQNSLDQGA